MKNKLKLGQASTVLLELIDTAPIIIANATTPAACPNFNLFFI